MPDAGAVRHAERILSTVQSTVPASDNRHIVGSWRRCVIEHKLDPTKGGPPRTLTRAELKDFIEPMGSQIHLAMPEIDNFYSVVRLAGYCVNLADKNAVMLASRIPPADAAEFRRWKLYDGSIFSETVEGTNGIGTCLAEERPVAVHCTEHFREHWGTLSCIVAPVFNHAGRIAGALNITSCHADPRQPSNAMMLAATILTARRIEERIFRAHYSAAWIASYQPGDDGGGGLIAFDADHRIVGASRSARHRLGLTDAAIDDGMLLSDVMQYDRNGLLPSSGRTMPVRQPDGARFAHLEISAPVNAPRRAAPLFPPREQRASSRGDALLHFAGSNAALARDMRRLIALDQHDLPILLRGATGTGKDLLARTIHAASSRADRPYVALNCAALPESLIDSELFGYESGAFTGARRDGARGLIAQAHGGVLFLDEIGDMPLGLQTRLLRVLENREVLPLGARRPVPVDFRLISATHQDLGTLVQDGRFRADLYYRLRGIQIELPCLRDRTDKAELIARLAHEEAPQATLRADAMTLLLRYSWPGNIRQLRHTLRLAGCTAVDGIITPEDLDLVQGSDAHAAPATRIREVERSVINDALRDHAGHVPAAAHALGLSRATLYRKMKRLHITA